MKVFMLPGRRFLICILVVFLSACARLPVIGPADQASAPEIKKRCQRPFLDVPYSFVHVMEASLPGGKAGTLIGVTVFDPASRTVESAILTIEGFVLFHARYDKEVFVNRAVPPFKADHFAANMMEDVRLIFLAPEGRLLKAGLLTGGSAVCRYDAGQGQVVDVVVHKDETWEIGKYNANGELLRQVRAFNVREGIPAAVELNAFGFREYSLRLKLISAEALRKQK